MLMYMTIDKDIKHELRVSTVVTHLCLIGESVIFLNQTQMDGIYAGAVVIQRIEMTGTVDARLWGGVQIK